MPVQKKKSKTPGDTAESVAARREFLVTGHYQPLVNDIYNRIIEADRHHNDKNYQIIDSGCGEGYYSAALLELLQRSSRYDYTIKGFDISRPAIKVAARTHSNIQFAVASAFEIPCPNESLDCVIQIFSPAAESEIRRILKPNGIYICVSPGDNHLIEIRHRLYKEVKARQVNEPLASSFDCVGKFDCEFSMFLKNEKELSNLLRMTPHFWKASAEKRTDLLELKKLDVTASFIVSVYKRLEIKTASAIPQ